MKTGQKKWGNVRRKLVKRKTLILAKKSIIPYCPNALHLFYEFSEFFRILLNFPELLRMFVHFLGLTRIAIFMEIQIERVL